VPPPDVLKTPTQIPKVVNRSNGSVTDPDAARWVTAFIREQQIEVWVETHDQQAVLTMGCLGSQDSAGQTFGEELRQMRTASASGKHIEIVPTTYVSVALVKLTDDVKANVRGFDGVPSDYAVILEVQGPGGHYYVDTAGNRTPASVVQPTDHFWLFIGGHYAENSIGPIWLQDSVFNCLTSWLRATCSV
jgi:hypothetical protein